jgi:hypothetical protein
LSAVGAAFSAGAAGVCAPAPELNAKAPAIAAAAISDLVMPALALSDLANCDSIVPPIAISLFLNVRLWCGIIAEGDRRSQRPSLRPDDDATDWLDGSVQPISFLQ